MAGRPGRAGEEKHTEEPSAGAPGPPSSRAVPGPGPGKEPAGALGVRGRSGLCSP